MPTASSPLSVSGATPVSLVKRTDRLAGRGPNAGRLTNAYLQDCSRQVVLLKFQQYVTVICLVIMILLLANFSSTNYRVFGTNRDMTLTALPPVDQEVMDNVLSLWVADAMIKVTTLGFHDYDMRLAGIRNLFTDRGWESFSRFVRASHDGRPSIRAALETRRLLMWGVPATPPQILQRGLVGGVMSYRIRIDLTVKVAWTYAVPKIPEFVELTVERVRPEINPAGLAISQWRLYR